MTDTQIESVAPEVAEPMKKDWRAGRPQIQPEIMTERGAEIFGFFSPCKIAVVICCLPRKHIAREIACVASLAAGGL